MLMFSSVTPVLKFGGPTVVSNYRSIFIESHISKMFEIVLNAIQPSINDILIGEQYGFCLRHSTTICNL